MAIIADTSSAASSKQAAIPDKHYFYDNGDLEVHVGRTIFKVHSVLFARLGACRFKAAPTTDSSEGSIFTRGQAILKEITSDDFRALCWAVYVLRPWDTMPDVDVVSINRMLSLASVSQLYGFTDLRSWVSKYLARVTTHIASLSVDKPLPSGLMSRLLWVCKTCRFANTARDIENMWLTRLRNADLSAFPEALSMAGAPDTRRFCGYAYYHLLCASAAACPRLPAHRGTAYDIPGITHDQRDRLLDGSYSLTLRMPSMVRKIRRVVFKLDRYVCDDEDHEDVCLKYYKRCVDQAVALPGLLAFDVLELIGEVIAQLRSETRIHRSCKKAAIKRLQLVEDDIGRELADHFTPAAELRIGH